MTGSADAATVQFLDWARSILMQVSDKVAIVPDSGFGGGRKVVCVSPLKAEDVIVLLPAGAAISVQMGAERPPDDMAPLSGWWEAHPQNSIRLAALLVWQREKWKAYIDMLAELKEIDAPWTFEDAELRSLDEAVATKATEWRRILEEAWQDLSDQGFGERVPRELFFRAHHAAASRAFSGEDNVGGSTGTIALAASAFTLFAALFAGVSGTVPFETAAASGTFGLGLNAAALYLLQKRQVLSLLPMVDQVNHASGPKPALVFDPVQNAWELRAGRAYQPGDEVVFSYGEKDNDTLFLQHGFVEKDNSSDAIEIPLSSEAPADALAALTALGVERLRFQRSGKLTGIAGPVIGSRVAEAPPEVLAACAPASIKHAAAQGLFAEDGDNDVSALSSPSRSQLVKLWRQEKRRMLEEIKRTWRC